MSALNFDVDDERLARIAWSRLAEPGDQVAGALVANLGAPEALRWLLERGQPGLGDGLDADAPATDVLRRAAAGWETRLGDLDPRRDLRAMDRLEVIPVFPGDADWPVALNDLGPTAPLVLWVRGDLAALARPAVAIVGSRASTSYGETVASDLAAGLVERGFTVVSGGAYGIDAAVHRAALAAGRVGGGATVAVMPAGLDRLYPPGNTKLLQAVGENGALVAEVPPGSVAYRHRFLARNRLIAALGRATVVVEAAWRSGALSTARHAVELARPLGAVPGPVTSMASAGCHQLMRDGLVVCVTDAEEVAELAGPLDVSAKEPNRSARDPLDGFDSVHRAVYNVLPLSATATVKSLANSVGQPTAAVLGALGVLGAHGLARQSETGRWGRGTSGG